MQLTVQERPDGVTVATLAGRLDIDGAAKIDMQVGVLAASSRALVLDLGGVSFLASMGLRTLITCGRTVAAKGGKVALARPQENVARVLTSSGAGEFMAVRPTLEDAVAHVRS